MTFTMVQSVLFKHCDPAGIVFYPRYFEMISDCVEAFFDEELGISFAKLHKTAGVPTVQFNTRFSAPSRHGETLQLKLDCTKLGHTSLGLAITATCDDKIRFETTQTIVYINKTGDPKSWPKPLRSAIENHLMKGS